MTEIDLIELMPQLEAFHKRFHGFFCRSEGRKWSMKYLQGLMMPIERKNVENIAEEVAAPPRKLQEFGEGGLLGPDTTYIHCTTLNDTEIQMIVDTGGTVSLACPVEMMMGHGLPPIQKFLDRGLRPSLSVDVETNVPNDMFNQMRSVLALQRAIASSEGKRQISPREVLEPAAAGPPLAGLGRGCSQSS